MIGPRSPGQENVMISTVSANGQNNSPFGSDVRLPHRMNVLYQKSAVLLGPEDVLQISVVDHPELNVTTPVDPWGFIKLPYIPELQVQGLTVDVVEEILTQKYSEFFVKPPEVEISVEQYNSQVVYVLGAVGHEGKYPLIKGRPMTLRDALVGAGLPTPRAALWRVFVIRQSDNGPVSQHINCYEIIYRNDLTNNISLEAGDVVYVPMTLLDTIASFFGRIVSPIFGTASRTAGAVLVP
jgi:polysaccharide export outer membrane protein